MAADYDKLFRPHEGMEAPDDMAAQPFFDRQCLNGLV